MKWKKNEKKHSTGKGRFFSLFSFKRNQIKESTFKIYNLCMGWYEEKISNINFDHTQTLIIQEI